MSKYANLAENIYSVFSLSSWTVLNIKTLPSNYIGITNNTDYIRVSVLPFNTGINSKSSSGQVNIDIFVKAGIGPKSILTIADHLDTFLQNKSLKVNAGVTQFYSSSLNIMGVDKDNSTLFRALYSIPFNHFNEV